MPYLTKDGRALLEADTSPDTVEVSTAELAELAGIRDLYPAGIVSPADQEAVVDEFNRRKGS